MWKLSVFSFTRIKNFYGRSTPSWFHGALKSSKSVRYEISKFLTSDRDVLQTCLIARIEARNALSLVEHVLTDQPVIFDEPAGTIAFFAQNMNFWDLKAKKIDFSPILVLNRGLTGWLKPRFIAVYYNYYIKLLDMGFLLNQIINQIVLWCNKSEPSINRAVRHVVKRG